MPPAGIEPATYRLHTTSAFAALAVRGLDFAFNRSGCSSSSLYTFPCGLGSALPVKGSPNLGRFTYTFLCKSSIESRMLYHLSYRGVYYGVNYNASIPDVKSFPISFRIKKPSHAAGESFTMTLWGGVDSPYDESFMSLNQNGYL